MGGREWLWYLMEGHTTLRGKLAEWLFKRVIFRHQFVWVWIGLSHFLSVCPWKMTLPLCVCFCKMGIWIPITSLIGCYEKRMGFICIKIFVKIFAHILNTLQMMTVNVLKKGNDHYFTVMSLRWMKPESSRLLELVLQREEGRRQRAFAKHPRQTQAGLGDVEGMTSAQGTQESQGSGQGQISMPYRAWQSWDFILSARPLKRLNGFMQGREMPGLLHILHES